MHRRLLNGCGSRDRCRSGSFASNESSESLSSDSTALSDRQTMTRVFYNSRYSSARHKQTEQHTQENLEKAADNVSEDRLDEKNREDIEPRWTRNRKSTNGHTVDSDTNYHQNREKNSRNNDRHSRGYYHNGYLCFRGRSQSRSAYDHIQTDTRAVYQSTDNSLDNGASCDASSENSLNISKSEESHPISDAHQTPPCSEHLMSPSSSHALINTPNVWKEREEFKRDLTPKSEEEEATMLQRALEESRIPYEHVQPYLDMVQDSRTSLDDWLEPVRTGADAVRTEADSVSNSISAPRLVESLESENKNKLNASIANRDETGGTKTLMPEPSHSVTAATFSLPVVPQFALLAISEPSCSNSLNASGALVKTAISPISLPLPQSLDDRDNVDSETQPVELSSKSVEAPSSLSSYQGEIYASDILHNSLDISLRSNPVFADSSLHISNQVISTCDIISNESDISDVTSALHHSNPSMQSADVDHVVDVMESAAICERYDSVSPTDVCIASVDQSHILRNSTNEQPEQCDLRNSSAEVSQVNVSSSAEISRESLINVMCDSIEMNGDNNKISSHHGMSQLNELQQNVAEAERRFSCSDVAETSPRPCFTPAFPPHFYHPGYWPMPHPGMVPYCPTAGPGVMLPYMMPQGAGPPEAFPRMMVVGPFIGPGGPFMPYPPHGPMMSGYHGEATEGPVRFPMAPMGYVVHSPGMHPGNIMVPNGGIMMPNNGMVMSNGSVPNMSMMVPSSAMMVPNNGIMVPHSGMMMPHNGMMIPNNGMMISSDGSFSGRFMTPGGMYPGVMMMHEGGIHPRGFTGEGGECNPYPSHHAPRHQNSVDTEGSSE